MIALVWASLAAIAYTYLGFPLLLLARARFRPRPVLDVAAEPSVTVIIAAHNEAAVIGRKLESVLASDYPTERLEIIVASDGSMDATARIAEAVGPRVQVLDLPRVGKAAALDAAIAKATSEVIVFTDANSVLMPSAIRELVRGFGDPSVGGVAGDQRYSTGDGAADAAAGERSYWNLDRLLKRAESEAGSVISATGALYAVRRDLVGKVPEGVTDDFALSTAVIEAGARLIFQPKAIAVEPPAASTTDEWGRKVRVITRGLQGVLLRRRLLDWRRYGFYAVQLASHKILRRLMFVPLAGLAVGALGSWRSGAFYRLLAAGQMVFYAAAALGLVLGRGGRPVSRLLALPGFFVMVNAASAVAVFNVLTGRRVTRWQPHRGAAADDAPATATIGDPDSLDRLRHALARVLAGAEQRVDASIVIPVNAQGDLDNVVMLLDDIAAYRGSNRFEIVLVLNNYPEDRPPRVAADALRSLGVKLLEIPTVPTPPGQARPLSARIPGMESARSNWVILLDADCRILDATALLDWYVDRGKAGDGVAYTRVDYTGLRRGMSVRARMWAHHTSRWTKRVMLRVPTTRGSSYAVDRDAFHRQHAAGFIADDINVGPAIRAAGGEVSYSGDRRHTVLTSGRMFRGGWSKLFRYLRYRLAYNVRVLPVRRDVAARTGREHDPAGRFDYRRAGLE